MELGADARLPEDPLLREVAVALDASDQSASSMTPTGAPPTPRRAKRSTSRPTGTDSTRWSGYMSSPGSGRTFWRKTTSTASTSAGSCSPTSLEKDFGSTRNFNVDR